MDVFPAIDVLSGKAVRLHKGSYEHVTVYADDPALPAKAFHREGATTIHVVDLDGAREGRPVNVDVVRRILDAVPVAVEVGGGIRDEETATRWLEAGASRVVLGTAAIKSPEWVRALAARAPEAVVVALDARGGEIAVEGWLEGTGRTAGEVAREVAAWTPAPWGILYTNIDRDGTREGPDVEGTAALQRAVSCTVIASGGIGSIADLVALERAGVRAAVVGRALYSSAFTLREALDALGERGQRGEGA
jgi:phosphoribosylformimino-5-aminoimidazole carboxamide ribotide isomerase